MKWMVTQINGTTNESSSSWFSSKFWMTKSMQRNKTRDIIIARMANTRHRRRFTPFHCAVNSGHVHVVEWLLQLGVPVNAVVARGTQALHLVCVSGDTDMALALLAGGAEVGARDGAGMTALHICCE